MIVFLEGGALTEGGEGTAVVVAEEWEVGYLGGGRLEFGFYHGGNMFMGGINW